jgi:hypothetical protein
MILRSVLATATVLGILSLAVPSASSAQGFGRLSPSEAEARCFKRSVQYAYDSRGPNNIQPSDYQVRAAYLRCYFGFTRQEATRVPVRDRKTRSVRLVPR